MKSSGIRKKIAITLIRVLRARIFDKPHLQVIIGDLGTIVIRLFPIDFVEVICSLPDDWRYDNARNPSYNTEDCC